MGYGLLLILSALFVFRIIRKKLNIKYEAFLIIWFLGQASLIFLPISVQRRFLEGYQIVLAVLAGYFIKQFLEKRQWIIRGKLFAITIFILLFSASFLVVMYLDFYNIYSKAKMIYLTKNNLIAMRELKKVSNSDDLILADIYTSNMLPGMILHRVFVGHGVETIKFKQKLETLNKFALSTDKDERRAILNNNYISWFFYDKSWNWGFDPDSDNFLKKVYERGDYKIYKVEL